MKNTPLRVIFCDNHLLVVFKPAGLSTQPHEGMQENLCDQAKKWVKQEFKKPGNVFLEPIHRLDQVVSGLVLFARTSKALSRLQEMMRERQIHKTYRAYLKECPSDESGVLEHYLIHADHRAQVVSKTHPQAKQARLKYQVTLKNDLQTEVEIELETGRYHQIRAQFAQIGCPIIGDQKYGSKTVWKQEGIALSHVSLSFIHPVTKEPVRFCI